MCRCMCECLRMLILERRGEERRGGGGGEKSVVGEGKGRGKKGDVMRAEEGRGGHKR